MASKNTKSKVLYLSYDGLTDPLGQSQVLPYIIGLRKKGFGFTVISFEKPENFQKEESVINDIVNENNIGWNPLKYTKRPPILSTVYDIFKLKQAIKKEAQKGDVSLIHCRSYITALVGLWAKNKYGIPFVFDMRGFWADERVDGKIWDLKNIIHKKVYAYFKKKEKEYLVEAAHTISLTYAGKEEINSWNLKGQSPIKVIPCCTDDAHFNISKKENKRNELGLSSDDFVISYLGSIGTWYMLDEMLDFFKVLSSIKSHAKFLFITKDDLSFILDKCVEKGISKDTIVIKSSSRNDVPEYINTSDASIFFIKPVYSKKASSPTKMGEIMNMGVPIVCNAGVGDVDVVMNEAMPELLVNNFDITNYQQVANELINYYEKKDVNKIVDTSVNYFSLEKGIESYFQVYQSVLNLK
jgi:glycosyltransferase involved in cell wall biosynthesis